MRKVTTVDLHQSNTNPLSKHEEDVHIAGLTLFDQHRGPRRLFSDSTIAEDGSKVPATISVPDDVVDSLFREDLKCGVCLGTLNITLTITQCFHRFCSECLHRSLRMELGPKSHHECPSCRAKLASRRASKPDMKYDSLIRIILANGRKRRLSISPHDDDDDDGSAATKTTNPTGRQPLRKDPVQPHRLDLEKYRIAHLEKVNEFRERQSKLQSVGGTSHKPDKKANHKAKAGGNGHKGQGEKHQHGGKTSSAKGSSSYPSIETAAAASSLSNAKVWMSLFPLPEVSTCIKRLTDLTLTHWPRLFCSGCRTARCSRYRTTPQR